MNLYIEVQDQKFLEWSSFNKRDFLFINSIIKNSIVYITQLKIMNEFKKTARLSLNVCEGLYSIPV